MSKTGCGFKLRSGVAIALLLVVVAAMSTWGAHVRVAFADDVRASPSVLVIDAALGDVDLCSLHWLGEDAEVVKENNGRELRSSATPAWWDGDDAPSTFVLCPSNRDSTITSEDVVWALDAIGESGAEQRSLIVAFGPSGLAVREYVEDLADVKQSSRADVVGMVFCGTPQNGYQASTVYPESALWEKLANSIGVTKDDLVPGSTYLSTLNGGSFPRICKSLVISGVVGDLGFGPTDGAGIGQDFELDAAVSNQVERVDATATVSRSINLSGTWQPFTSSIDYPDRKVDAKLAERLSAMDCYETSAEVQKHVTDFYRAWFLGSVPVTHSANCMLYDLSGSMQENIDANTSKLDAAQQAGKEYLHAMRTYSELPLSSPISSSVLGFAEQLSTIANTYDDDAIAALQSLEARGETNIGAALDAALVQLTATPTCSTKRILLLSDGASTEGLNEEQMIKGPVAEAKKQNVVIDAVGFGDVGESNEKFLQKAAKTTGGKYYSAKDTYSLRIDFLKSYFSSVAGTYYEGEVKKGSSATETIVTVDQNTDAIQIGIVFKADDVPVQLLCNGEAVDESLYTTSKQDGFVSIRCLDPNPGEYSFAVLGKGDAMHVFGVQQQGVDQHEVVAKPQTDYSLVIVISAAALLLVAVVVVFATTRRRANR